MTLAVQTRDSFASVTSFSIPCPQILTPNPVDKTKLPSTTSYNIHGGLTSYPLSSRFSGTTHNPSNKNGALLREGHFRGGPQVWPFCGAGQWRGWSTAKHSTTSSQLPELWNDWPHQFPQHTAPQLAAEDEPCV